MKNQILSEEFSRMQKLAGIITEIKAISPTKPAKYALINNEELLIFTQEEFDDYIEDLAEGDEISEKEALDYVKENEYLIELPSSPYLFIYQNDEDIEFFDADNKKEFIDILDEYWFEFDDNNYEKNWQEILDHANDSYLRAVIENGIKIAGQ